MLPAARRLLALSLSAWLALGPAADARAQSLGVPGAPGRSLPSGPFQQVSPLWAQAFQGFKSDGVSLAQGSILSRVLEGAERPGGSVRLAPLVQILESRGLKPADIADRSRFGEVEQSARIAAENLQTLADETLSRYRLAEPGSRESVHAADELKVFETGYDAYLPRPVLLAVRESLVDSAAWKAALGVERSAAAAAKAFGAPGGGTEIVLLSARANSGHAQAARAIQAQFHTAAPEVPITLKTLNEEVSPAVSQAGGWLYSQLLTHRWVWEMLYDNPVVDELTKLPVQLFLKLTGKRIVDSWNGAKPRAAIATQALMAAAMASQDPERLGVPLFGVLTDFTVNSFWVRPEVRHYFVPTKEVKGELVRRGVDKKRITVSGIPIHPKFSKPVDKAAARRKLGLDPALPTLLVTGGNHGLGGMEVVLEASAELKTPHQVVVVTGGNKELYAKLKARYKGRRDVRIHGFVDDMERWMSASDLLIGKPGGLTSSEAMALGLPLVILDPLPGQETRNTEYLTRKRAAVLVEDAAGLAVTLEDLLAHPYKLRRLQRRASKLGRPEAASVIREGILRLLARDASGGSGVPEPGTGGPRLALVSALNALSVWLCRARGL